MAKYEFRQGYRGPRTISPATAAAELERLRGSGPLTASRVVEAAKPAAAPLHDAFIWDDAEAGYRYRLVQARTLIRALVIVDEQLPQAPPVSVFVHVPDVESPEGKYVPTVTVIEREDEYERALAEAQRDLDSAEARFRELRRLAEGRGGKIEALAIAAQGFSTVREALALLRATA